MPLIINCVLNKSLNNSVNFFLNLPTNLVNLSSSLVISDDLPKLKP